MDQSTHVALRNTPWNKGKVVGQKAPLKSATNGACQVNPVFRSQAQGHLLRVSAIPIAHAALQRLGTPARTAAILLLLRRTQVNARALTQMLHWVYGLTSAEIRLALLLQGGPRTGGVRV
jgi:hypothetical protein